MQKPEIKCTFKMLSGFQIYFNVKHIITIHFSYYIFRFPGTLTGYMVGNHKNLGLFIHFNKYESDVDYIDKNYVYVIIPITFIEPNRP